MKKRNILIIASILFGLFFIGYVILINTQTTELNIVSGALGNIKIKVTPAYNIFAVSQTVFFPKETAELGETIELRDSIYPGVGKPMTVYHIILRSDEFIDLGIIGIDDIPNLQIAKIDVTSLIKEREGALDVIITTITPTEIGYYTVFSQFIMPDSTIFTYVPYNQVQVVEKVEEPVEEIEIPFPYFGDEVPEPESELPTDTGAEIQEPILISPEDIIEDITEILDEDKISTSKVILFISAIITVLLIILIFSIIIRRRIGGK